MFVRARHSVISATVLYAAFAFTGFATALIGATLPALLQHWHLTDARAGLLFLLLFLGTSCGALLSRGAASASTLRGLLILAPACLALAFAGPLTVLPLCLLYGLGLGITITSINLLRSERNPTNLIAELNRLNLIWATGAFLCPALAALLIRTQGIRLLFLTLTTFFAVFAAWLFLVELKQPAAAPHRPMTRGTSNLPCPLPWSIALLTLLATGFESSSGAWLATYAARLQTTSQISIASVFWFGLLASRTLHATRLIRPIPPPALLRNAVALAALGGILLVASQSPAILLVAALLIGLGIGPVYPLLVAATLPRVAGNTIFLMAGLGGALFPWLIGTVSAHTGSLRTGLLIPAGAGLLMLTLQAAALRALSAKPRQPS